MKKRSTEILQIFIDRKDSDCSLSNLADAFGVNQKTIRNDLAEINDFLSEIGLSQITLNHDGVFQAGSDFDRKLICRKLSEMSLYQYRLSPEERRIYILAVLLHDPGYIIMRKLADEMYVTRVTILNDFDKIREELSGIGINLTSDSGKGVCLECTTAQRIHLLLEIFSGISVSTRSMGFFQQLILGRLDLRYRFHEIFSLMQEYMYENHLVLTDDICYGISLYLYAAFSLVFLGASPAADGASADFSGSDVPADTSANPPRRSSPDCMDSLMLFLGRRLSVPVTPEMLHSFRIYRWENDLNSNLRTVDEIELYEVVTCFLASIDNDLGLVLSDDSTLIDSLVLHIRNLRGWNEKIHLPKSEGYDIDYDTLMYAVEDYAYIIEKYLCYELNENMKISIVIHICVSLIRNNQSTSRISVIIVCPGSMATGKYLETQVRTYFNFHILGVVASSVLYRRLSEIEEVDFLLTTVNIRTDVCPVLMVHPVLTIEDLDLIQKTSFSLSRGSGKIITVKPIYKTIQALRTMVEEKRFTREMYRQLKEVFELYEAQQKQVFTAIGLLLHMENILVDDRHLYPDWRSAIAAAGKVLEIRGIVTEEYVEQSINNLVMYGDYIIIGKGTALAHARKEYGALSTGLSLIVSREGILFSDGETRVHFLFFYATTEETTDVQLFREIAAVGRDEERSARLLSMNREELWAALCENAV